MSTPDIATLQARILSLEKENATLKQLLAQHGISIPKNQQVTAMQRLSSYEKVELFASLFRGREDVFARRWHSRATSKSGYQPVCVNEWQRGLCDKKRYRCAECPNREFSPLTNEHIYHHLEGKHPDGCDVIGIYPILNDNTCWFLCADFDDKSCEHGYQNDVLAYVDVCHSWGIPAHIERSRSGNGAHVWIIFDTPVAAHLARRLGFAVLTEAMQRNGTMSFKSYDRFFPNQDTLPEGGLGNLVALPLQGQARKKGNSVFVDENFNPFPDQWEYLMGFTKMSEQEVADILKTHGQSQELGVLTVSTESKPWEPPIVEQICDSDFFEEIHLVRANMLYVPRKEISAKITNYLRRLAAFKNPELYSRQGMRLPIFNIPRIISCSELTDNYIALPRGCEEEVIKLLDEHHVSYAIEDETQSGTTIGIRFNGTLRDEQADGLERLMEHRCGTLSAATAFGKTVLAAALIAQRGVSTLILVHSKALLSQWREALSRFLDIDFIPPETKGRGRKRIPSAIGALCTGENSLHGVIDIALIQSCLDDDEVKPFVRNYGMVIADECHHVSAVTFERVMKAVAARYVYGLTATPIRKDGHQPIIFMQCGPIRFQSDALTQMLGQTFLRTLVPRFTTYRLLEEGEISFTQLQQKLSENDTRNNLIVSDAVSAIKEGRTPIILTSLVAHVKSLCEMLQPHCPNIIPLTGTTSSRERRLRMQQLQNIPPSESLIIVATGRYIGEGFDFPRLDTLLLALPISWKGLVAQYAGRLHREYDGKCEVRIYDYIDIRVPICDIMYRRRLKGYTAIGYNLQSPSTLTMNVDENIFNGSNYKHTYLNDISSAKESIVIACPKANPKYFGKTISALREASIQGVTVVIHTKDASPLTSSEIPTIENSNLTLNCTIIDRRLIWYGSINPFGYVSSDDTTMRLSDYSIAEELLHFLYA